jgi:hypothetical protein
MRNIRLHHVSPECAPTPKGDASMSRWETEEGQGGGQEGGGQEGGGGWEGGGESGGDSGNGGGSDMGGGEGEAS